MKNIAIEGQVEWKFFRDRASKYWVAVCEPLKQTASGETWAELNESIAQTLDLVFREVLERDELESFLRQQGWKISRQEQLPPSRKVRFDVPWKLSARRGAYAKEAALC
jgi:predicted RNase H-like HicB family nuclease